MKTCRRSESTAPSAGIANVAARVIAARCGHNLLAAAGCGSGTHAGIVALADHWVAALRHAGGRCRSGGPVLSGRYSARRSTKEAEPPLRYDVKIGSDSIAIGGANGRASRIDHYCALIEDYDPSAMIERLRTEGLQVGNQGLVGDPDGLRLQLLGLNESFSSLPAEALASRRPSVRITDQGPVVTPIALERVVLVVSDLERALPFYRLFFGAESRRDADGVGSSSPTLASAS